jgi:excisionase family DNA binding protein
MENIILSPVSLSDLEAIIQRSVEHAFANSQPSHLSDATSGDLLNIKQAAEFLSLSVPTIYTKVSKRELPYMKRAKRLYFSKMELLEYIKKGKTLTKTEAVSNAHNHLIRK